MIKHVYCSTVLIDSGAMHNFLSTTLVQAVQATTINIEPMCVTLGNKFKVLSTKLAKLNISFAFGAAQMVWCCIVPKLSAPVILGMDWLTQLNPKINCSKKMIEWTSNNTNVFLEACGLCKTCSSIGSLNLIGTQQFNNLVHMIKGGNVLAWIIQCSVHS